MENRSSFHENLTLRNPTSADGAALNLLVKQSPPLDGNSVYCNLLQCTHFSETSVAAVVDNTLVGFISGYFPPNTPNSLFIWQVVVAEKMRGSGLGKKMLNWIVNQPVCEDVTSVCTTITADNNASWGLFQSFARDLGATANKSLMFDRDLHFAGEHDDEYLLTLSPVVLQSMKSMQDHIDDLKGNMRSRIAL